MSAKRHIPSLDGVRGLAIALVLSWHYFVVPIPSRPGTWVDILRRLASLDWSGVDLFFVLSGFLIATGLMENRGAGNYFGAFYVRRACRILPVYYLSLLLFLLVRAHPPSRGVAFGWLFNDAFPLGWYATFTQNLAMAKGSSFGANWLAISWSLAIEEQFYLVFPLVVFLLPQRVLPAVLALGVASAPILRLTHPGMGAFVDTPMRMDSLLSGALLAWAVRQPAVREFLGRRRRAALWALAAVAGASAVWLLQEPAGNLIIFLRRFGPFGLTGLALAYTLFLGISLDSSAQPGRLLSGAPLAWLGRRSYGIYLLHQPLLGLGYAFSETGSFAHPQLVARLVIWGALAATLLLAEISFRYFETPINRLGHRVPYRPNRP